MNININQVIETTVIPVKVYIDDYYYEEYVDNCISFGEDF